MNNPFIKLTPIQRTRVEHNVYDPWRAKIEEYYLLYFKDKLVSNNIRKKIIDDNEEIDRNATYKPLDITYDGLSTNMSSKYKKTKVVDDIKKHKYNSTYKPLNIVDNNDFEMKISNNGTTKILWELLEIG